MWLHFLDNNFNNVYNNFLSELQLDNKKLGSLSNKNQTIKIIIKTDEKNNIITNEGKKYYKDKFLSNINFRNDINKYYKKYNFVVKGPVEIIDNYNNSMGIWYIELIKE